jgi:hypothetical protein
MLKSMALRDLTITIDRDTTRYASSRHDCYVFLTYYCAHNGLPLGPSLYFVINNTILIAPRHGQKERLFLLSC